MNKYIQKIFQVTPEGASGIIRASVSSLLSVFSFTLPLMLIFSFSDTILQGKTPALWHYLLAIPAVMIVMYVILYWNYNTLYTETYKECANLRKNLAQILKELPLSYFSRRDVSDISQTVMKDVADIEHAMSHAIPEAIGVVCYLFIMGVMMIIFHWRMGLAVIIPCVLSLLLIVLSKKMQVSKTTKHWKKLRESSEAFQEAIELQQEIKSCGLGERFEKKLNRISDESEKIHIETEMSQGAAVNLSAIAARLTLGSAIMAGIFLYGAGNLSLLFFIAYVIGAAKITDALMGLETNLAEIMYIDARIKRIKEIRETPVQKGEKVSFRGYDIVFDNVRFGYNEDTEVINGLSFIAKQNEVTALVGPSGCGKTTAIRLLSRLYDADSGVITMGGINIAGARSEDLFEAVSIVFQDVTLFNASVLDNIRIGRADASDDEVKEAAGLANCMEFIERLPEGFNSLIGENGSRLSGGERQRLSIARAFLKNAPVILLDEISASLDVENEQAIQESLSRLIKGKTVITISHRMKSVEGAHRIVVMNEGRTEASGDHETLMKNCALYRRMVEKSRLTEDYAY